MESTNASSSSSPNLELYEEPGHLIRRAHQIAVAMFHEELGGLVTPVQYAFLRKLYECPGLDQVTLAQRVALDTSTTADMAARLEAKGWIVRQMLPRRQRKLLLTPLGEELITRLTPNVKGLRDRLLERMDEKDAGEFIRLLGEFVNLNNEQSRAPLRIDNEVQ
ncbi:MarR family transcriptional regulator [Burkholderia sp. SG-MS1]|uniref:MarR family winged helix-turn-helix transcriptional regulator n=1 Tax=Paraburkholderia sp. SG-MS1 TaxID=2023741 RepID=UPI001447AF0B|nr:MarR family transcriptional regulator [Paraburkholderia sp. SG-MS1]NKJ49019.1 MarR family transcriptional regulator [Paraburkholderia sp. SG-MS1]